MAGTLLNECDRATISTDATLASHGLAGYLRVCIGDKYYDSQLVELPC